jgi:hypothetical protein
MILTLIGKFQKKSLANITCRSFSTLKYIKAGGTWEELLKDSTIFIDKSLFIKQVLEDSNKCLLITMPRRWGKTLNLEMLRRFLDTGERMDSDKIKDNPNYDLFYNTECRKPLKITQATLEKKIDGKIKKIKEEIFGKHPVIYMDLKNCNGHNYEHVKRLTIKELYKTVNNFKYLSNVDGIKGRYKQLVHELEKGVYEDSLLTLSKLLHEHHKQKVFILMDEYDAAANRAFMEFKKWDEAEMVCNLFRDFFEPAFKSNDALEKGVLTGVQRLLKSGIFSGLNNFEAYNMTDHKYAQYYGLTEEELDLLFEHFNIGKDQAKQIKNWYNGYQEQVGEEFICKYNIWSVTKYLTAQAETVGFKPKSYWEDSSNSKDLMKRHFKNKEIRNKVEELILDNSISISDLTVNPSVNDFKTIREIGEMTGNFEINNEAINLFFSFLFIYGYLTYDPVGNCKYKLPNKEIKLSIISYMKSYFRMIYGINHDQTAKVSILLDKVFNQTDPLKMDIIFRDEFCKEFQVLLESIEKGVDYTEDIFHCILAYIGVLLKEREIKSEARVFKQHQNRYQTRVSGKADKKDGRADIIIFKNKIGMIIEVKYGQKSEEIALEQALEYVMPEEWECSIEICLGCTISKDLTVKLTPAFSLND